MRLPKALKSASGKAYIPSQIFPHHVLLPRRVALRFRRTLIRPGGLPGTSYAGHGLHPGMADRQRIQAGWTTSGPVFSVLQFHLRWFTGFTGQQFSAGLIHGLFKGLIRAVFRPGFVTLFSVFLLSAPLAVLPVTVNSCSSADFSHRRSRSASTCCNSACLTLCW